MPVPTHDHILSHLGHHARAVDPKEDKRVRRNLVESSTLAVVVAAVLAGCGGTSSDDTAEETGTADATETTATPQVTVFEVGDLRCTFGTTAPVAVTWRTQSTTAVAIGVDSFRPLRRGPSGAADVVVPCDGEAHEITITPAGASREGESQSKEVSPE